MSRAFLQGTYRQRIEKAIGEARELADVNEQSGQFPSPGNLSPSIMAEAVPHNLRDDDLLPLGIADFDFKPATVYISHPREFFDLYRAVSEYKPGTVTDEDARAVHNHEIKHWRAARQQGVREADIMGGLSFWLDEDGFMCSGPFVECRGDDLLIPRLGLAVIYLYPGADNNHYEYDLIQAAALGFPDGGVEVAEHVLIWNRNLPDGQSPLPLPLDYRPSQVDSQN